MNRPQCTDVHILAHRVPELSEVWCACGLERLKTPLWLLRQPKKQVTT